MNSSLMPSYLDPDIFVNNISSTLYREHLENLYWTCRSIQTELEKSGEYIYNKICLHHNPHSIGDLPTITRYGDQEWYKEGKLHRDGDLPARIFPNGDQYWYKEGNLHRDGDLPAYIYAGGDKEWYKEGKLHRDGDLPARIDAGGDKEWYKEGKLHRDGDLPALIYVDGSQYWYKEGKRYK
jgi:antitoxin component YwqK of YwqJK toxin-antitoxin module